MNNLRSPNRKAWRLLNPDGTFNLVRVQSDSSKVKDLYHSLLVMPLWKLFVLVISFYTGVNFVFATAYYICGEGALGGLSNVPVYGRFLDCFFFSVQTIATIGYGKLAPEGIMPNLFVTIESLMGLIGFALTTGIFFARFSRPRSRVAFSRSAIISPVDGVPSLMLRMANQRANQIVEAKANIVLIKSAETVEGLTYRDFRDLELERDYSPIFAMSWLLVHEIKEGSPLFNITKEELRELDTEILVTLTGIDETFSETVHARASYTADEIIWGGRFKDMLSQDEMGRIRMDLDQLHVIEI